MGKIILPIIFLIIFTSCFNRRKKIEPDLNLKKATTTLDSLYRYYDAGKDNLLYTFPLGNNILPDLDSLGGYSFDTELYSALFPYSGTLSAASALLDVTGDRQYLDLIEIKVLPGLENYLDTLHELPAYLSHIKGNINHERSYEDNVWLGIDFVDIYLKTDEKKYLEKAKMVWDFVITGMDEELGGGIYRSEQKKDLKSTCANGAGAILALKMFKASKDSTYFNYGQFLYEWTKKNMQDTNDYLYFDSVDKNKIYAKGKYAYNAGIMLQASVILYKLTNNETYMIEAQRIAGAAHDYFFNNFESANGDHIKLLRKGNVWSVAVLLRGYADLFYLDGNSLYIDDYNDNLTHAWYKMRDTDGLFGTDWSGIEKKRVKWLLTQAAMVEMYARMEKIMHTE